MTEEYGPICYIVDSKDEQIAFMFQGPMNTPGNMYHLNSKFCHFATSNPKWILKLIENCVGKKVFDPGQEISYRWKIDDLKIAFQKSDIIILNKKEYEFSREFIPSGKDLIITMGKDGCVYNGNIISSRKISQKSTVGAGDAFRGGLYASLYRGYDMEAACRCANDVAFAYIERERSLDLLNWTALCKDNDV